MASVFLSYDREDIGKARPIAATLEKAGHFVWWDQHIKGGAQYSKEIEQALKLADAVVVLWSSHSVDSPWVRDEAAAGRDNGRLVPVSLDRTEPPLGFRQYQTIGLWAWKGSKRSPQFQQLLEAIEQIVGRAPRGNEAAATGAIRHSTDRRLPVRHLRFAALAIAALTLAALLLWQPWHAAASTPSVTVMPGGNNPRARDLAANLLVQLGSLQAADADLLHLVEPDTEAKADMIFKVAAVDGSTEPRASLSLVDYRASTLLWSREFVQPGGNEADLRQQLAYSAGQVLRCAVEALAPDHRKLELASLKLYLGGCAELSTPVGDPNAIVPLFRRVTEQAPRFPGGWAKLVVAELEAFKNTGASDLALQNQLRADIEKARKLDAEMAEPYLAESWLEEPRPILGWMKFADRALAKNPNHAQTLENHAIGMLHVGRMQEAVRDARRAVQAEPLSASARQTLISALMDAGAVEAARKELLDAERLWPGTTNLLQTRLRLESYFGDPREAIRMIESGRTVSAPSQIQRSFLEARVTPSPANIERAIVDARMAYRKQGGIHALLNALAAFRRVDELAEVLLSSNPANDPGLITVFFRPSFAALRRDRRFMKIAGRYGLTDYWRESGKWPDFCDEPDLPYDCKAEAAKLAA